MSEIVAISIGRPQVLVRGGRQYSTSINRNTVAGPLAISPDGVAGDIIGDQRVHGGPDKAICCYCDEHYDFWRAHFAANPADEPSDRAARGATFTVPAFGENLTTRGMLETEVCLGDVYRVGEARVQVTQPRQPCWKLANKHEEPRLITWVNERAYCGFYFRVLEGGGVKAGDAFELLERPRPGTTVERMLRIRLSPAEQRDEVARLAQMAELSASWRRDLGKILSGEKE